MKFKLPIGDWSGDGHSQCEWYVIEVTPDLTIEEIREHYFSNEQICRRNNWIPPSEILIDYENSYITSEESNRIPYYHFDEVRWENEKYHFTSEEVAKLVCNFLGWNSDYIFVNITVQDQLPKLNFYGYDDKGRHLQLPGYGIF